MKKFLAFYLLALLPFDAYARGSSNIGGIIYLAAMLGFAYIIMIISFGSVFLYSKFIAKIFNVSDETANSGWFPIACFYGTVFIVIFIGIPVYKSI
jgi:hypothetical protein